MLKADFFINLCPTHFMVSEISAHKRQTTLPRGKNSAHKRRNTSMVNENSAHKRRYTSTGRKIRSRRLLGIFCGHSVRLCMFFSRTHGPFAVFWLMATMRLGAFETDAVIGGRIIWIGNLFAIDCFDKFA
jgi:hypothetical protein